MVLLVVAVVVRMLVLVVLMSDLQTLWVADVAGWGPIQRSMGCWAFGGMLAGVCYLVVVGD